MALCPQPPSPALSKGVNERLLRRHRDTALSGKLLRMMTAMQAFGGRHQYSIVDPLIARDMGCKLFTSGLDASRFAPVVRFWQSFHLGIHPHIQPHYGMAKYLLQKIDRGRRCIKPGSDILLFGLRPKAAKKRIPNAEPSRARVDEGRNTARRQEQIT